MSDEAPFVTVYRGRDPVLAEMLEDVLETEGFDARLLGTRNAALLGAGQQIMALRIEVPADQAEDAAEAIEGILAEVDQDDEGEVLDVYGDDEEHEDGPSMERPDSAADDEYQPPRRVEGGGVRSREREAKRPQNPKRRAVALGLVVVMPGLGQVYARQPWAGLMLMLGLIGTFVVASVTLDYTVFGAAYVASFVVDIIAGQRAVTAFNEGRTSGAGAQVTAGVLEILAVQIAARAAVLLLGSGQ